MNNLSRKKLDVITEVMCEKQTAHVDRQLAVAELKAEELCSTWLLGRERESATQPLI